MDDTVAVRMLGANDACVLERVADHVFDRDINETYCTEFFTDPRHHIAVAVHGDTVVGMATGVHYLHPDKSDEFWINEVGVTPDRQRRGIGKRLVNCLLRHARDLGCTEAWVLTEKENGPARSLYRSTGGKEQTAVYVTYRL